MDAAVERRSATPDTAQDLASKYARAKVMLREQIDSNQALRLALREEQRQRRTLADGLETERAATAAAVRKVAELEDLLAQQRLVSLAVRQADAQTQATLIQPEVHPGNESSRPPAATTADASDGAAATAACSTALADAEARVEGVRRQAQADAEAAVEAVRRQAQAAQQRLCAQMLAALQQLQCEAQDLAVQTKQVAQQQEGAGHNQKRMVAA